MLSRSYKFQTSHLEFRAAPGQVGQAEDWGRLPRLGGCWRQPYELGIFTAGSKTDYQGEVDDVEQRGK